MGPCRIRHEERETTTVVHVKEATEIRFDDLMQVSVASFSSGDVLDLIHNPNRRMTAIRRHPTGEVDH